MEMLLKVAMAIDKCRTSTIMHHTLIRVSKVALFALAQRSWSF